MTERGVIEECLARCCLEFESQRDYWKKQAKTCRTEIEKEVSRRLELEKSINSKDLWEDLARLRSELSRVTEERDGWKKEADRYLEKYESEIRARDANLYHNCDGTIDEAMTITSTSNFAWWWDQCNPQAPVGEQPIRMGREFKVVESKP